MTADGSHTEPCLLPEMLISAVSTWTGWTWLVTFLIGLVTLYLVRHFQLIWTLPPGPLPIPVLGNLLMLRGEGNDLSSVVERLSKKYKDVFTLWMGHRPTVVVCSWDLSHESLVTKRNDFGGRVMRDSCTAFTGEHQDVVFSDFGPTWEVLRRVMSSGVRKYVMSEKLAELSSDVVDRVGEVMEKEGKPVDANTYSYLIMYNILASSAFGQRFEIDDPEFTELRKNNDEMNEKIGVGFPSDAVPILKVFYLKRKADLKRTVDVFIDYVSKRFHEHLETYQSGDIRDFTDAIIAAREEAEAEGKEALQYLTEGNMIRMLFDLFPAGTDTSRTFLSWILLLITDQPGIQKRMQTEIDKNIGSRIPMQKDKQVCHYVNAVLAEALRFRPVVDHTLEHRTTCNTEIGQYKIPKDTSCLFYIKGPQHSEEYWKEPKKFNPNHFLDANGKFINAKMNGYMPFGLGRRACPAEKLALADVFLVVVRLLQKYNFKMDGGPGSVDLNYNCKEFSKEPPPYKLHVQRRGK